MEGGQRWRIQKKSCSLCTEKPRRLMQSKGLASYFQGKCSWFCSNYLFLMSPYQGSKGVLRVHPNLLGTLCPLPHRSSIENHLGTVSCTPPPPPPAPPCRQAPLYFDRNRLAPVGCIRPLKWLPRLTENHQASANWKQTQKMRFSQIYELLQHSGSYCKDLYIAQTKLDNIYMLHVRTSV